MPAPTWAPMLGAITLAAATGFGSVSGAGPSDDVAQVLEQGRGAVTSPTDVAQVLQQGRGAVTSPTTTCPAGGVTIPTSATARDMQAAVDRHPAGTLFCMASGVHTHLSPVKLRAGNRVLGLGQATVLGAAVVRNWTRQSSTRWSAVLPDLAKPDLVINPYLRCDDGTDHCVYPDDVYHGNTPLTRVWSLSAQGSGQYFVDYAAKRLYVGVDPGRKPVYRSEPLPLGSSGYGLGLFDSNQSTPGQFSYLNISMVGTAMEAGAINGHVAVDHVDVSYSHGKGVHTSNGGRVTNSHLHHNGQIGIAAHHGAPKITDNEVDHNNWARCQGACGGIKLTSVDGAVAQRNNVHDNRDKGLWLDVGSINYLVDGNKSIHNGAIGLSLEISYDGVVSNNVVHSNGWEVSTRFGGIVVQATGSCRCAAGRRGAVEIYGNDVGDAGANGIALHATKRGSGNKGPYLVRDVRVHHNTVRLSGDAFVGASDSIGNSAVYGRAAGNTFSGNVYSKDVTTDLFKWLYGGKGNQYLTFSQWRSTGQDATAACTGKGC